MRTHAENAAMEAEITTKKSEEDGAIPARGRMPRQSTTVNNPRLMSKALRRMLRKRAGKI